ncbi:hypothetical protein [uncultured Ruegeria sp.]|uniref:hypothetical protein n=1 Tax=uncultured Ruegeria sp. TaxID=259304 RepID=UPI00262AEC20|nr:hypothetical protein [uncultured Ruegeria sp.]
MNELESTEVQSALRQLGWLSSYTRKVLLARHLVRNLSLIGQNAVHSDIEELADIYLLGLRPALQSFAGSEYIANSYSAPYEPVDRPRHYYLSKKRGERILSVTIAPRIESRLYFPLDDHELDDHPSQGIKVQDRSKSIEVLAQETRKVGRNVNLSNKEVADQRSYELTRTPLWQGLNDSGQLHDTLNQLSTINEATDGSFEFWIKWYQGLATGVPVDSVLQERVASIPDRVWFWGHKAVAHEISVIELDLLAQRAPMAETVRFNESTNKFGATPRIIESPKLLSATISQVQDALEDVLVDVSNGLNERSRETRVLHRTSTKYGNDPQRVEMDFTSVHAGLVRQIAVEDLPPSEANLALARALEEGAQALRATHQEIADNRRILEAQKIAELSDKQKAELAEALPILEEISEGIVQDDFIEDISFLTADSDGLPVGAFTLGVASRNPVLAGYDEKRRTFARIAQIAIILRKFPNLVHKIDGSTTYKAARILTTIGALATIGIALF